MKTLTATALSPSDASAPANRTISPLIEGGRAARAIWIEIQATSAQSLLFPGLLWPRYPFSIKTVPRYDLREPPTVAAWE